MRQAYQTIVLGLGAMGSAAAYQLAGKGGSVLGIDRFSPPHTLGSTHGDTRITRQAIGEGVSYTPLALRSNEIWRDLERQTGQELYAAVGGLIVCDPNSATAIHGSANFLQVTLDAAVKYGIAHEVLLTEELRRRFPQFTLHGNEIGYYEPGAGFLRPERCIEAQFNLARGLGADLHTNEQVLGYEPVGERVRVRTDQGEYEAEKLIVSAGPWVNEFLGGGRELPFNIHRQVLYWFDVEAHYDEFARGRFPVFIREFGTPDGGFYGFPAVDGRKGGMKVAAEDYAVTTTPARVDRTVTPEETRDMYVRRVRPYLDGVRGECLRSVTCLYTVTPDFDFVIGSLPGLPQVIVASPCSGHGFKHSAAIGEVLAEMATEGVSRLDVSSFTPERFLR